MADNTLHYSWIGINSQGQRVNGSLQAIDINGAQQELKKLGIEVIKLEEKKGSQFLNFSAKMTKKKVKTADILIFTRYLSTMLASGLPIVQALDIISRDQDNPTMQAIVVTLKNNIISGKTLAESFKQYPDAFSEIYCNLINAGEKSGTLDKILIRLANYLEKSENLKRKIKKAMVYPMAIMGIAMIVSLVLLLFVVPKFQVMFSSFGATLPLFTRMVIALSDVVRGYWYLIAGGIVVAYWQIKRLTRESELFREWLDKLSIKIFIIGPILKKAIIARYTRTLATTLDAGMPIIESLKTISQIMGNQAYSKAVDQIAIDVTNGQQLSTSMKNTNLFPNMAVQMIAVGEASGSMSQMMHKVADYYEDEVNNIVDNLSSLLEPVIMLVLGVIIGGFVIAMYLPIFKLGSLV